MVVVERGQDEYVLAVGDRGGDLGPGAGVRQGGVRRRRPTVPAADLAALTTLEIGGALTATQAKTVLAELVADGGGDAAAIAAAKGFEAMDSGALDGWSTRPSPPTPTRGRSSARGEGKAMGALVGAVMKLSQGKADGKPVTALLNQKLLDQKTA